MNQFYSHSDGYTYYLKNKEEWDNDELWACPTFENGKLDLENELPVKDFEEPLDYAIIYQIKQIVIYFYL